MHKVSVLILLSVVLASTTYAQKRECKNFNTVTYSGKGNVDTKKLEKSFEIFENLLKTRNTNKFIEKVDDNFTLFGRPIQSLKEQLQQLPNNPVCLQRILVNKNDETSIFFSSKTKPEEKMRLKMNEKFKYISLEKVDFLNKGKVALKGDSVRVPMIRIGNFSFIDGEVNGVKGRWMFDTGNPDVVSLHTKKVVNAKAEISGDGTGQVGSGETFTTLEYPLIEELKVGNIFFDSIPNVDANNMNYLENITSTVIGQVGFDFFKTYDIKIDYLRSKLTFYKQRKGVANWKDIETKKNYITSIPYFTRKMDNVPMFKINYKGVEFLVMLDTGGYTGILVMEGKKFNKVKENGNIEDFNDEPSSLYNLYNIKINNALSLNLYGILKLDGDPPYNEPLGINEKNTLVLGYSFFSQYITIWDTKNKIIHVFGKK